MSGPAELAPTATVLRTDAPHTVRVVPTPDTP
jgi:hypothetical protein